MKKLDKKLNSLFRSRNLNYETISTQRIIKNPHVEQITNCLKIMEECLANKQVSKSTLKHFTNYLSEIEFKNLNILSLDEEKSFYVIKIINIWICMVFINTDLNSELPDHMIILNDFYRFIMDSFSSKIQSQKMKIAQAHYFNNLALIMLRSKQFKNAIEYLLEAAQIYEKYKLKHNVFVMVYSNLGTIYVLLQDSVKSQEYFRKAIKLCKEIHKFLIKNQKENQIMENANLIGNLYTHILEVTHNIPSELTQQIEHTVLELVKNDFVKLNRRNWFVRRYIQKIKLSSEYKKTIFQTVFRINIKQLKLYSQPFQIVQKYRQRLPSLISKPTHSASLKMSTIDPNRSTAVQQQDQTNYLTKFIQRMQKLEQYQRFSQEFIIQNITKKIALLNESSIIVNSPQQSTLKPYISFKNAVVNIQFYEQGLILKTFGGSEEKIDWDQLSYILNNLQDFEMFYNQIQLNSNQYHLAKILMNYIEVKQSKVIIRSRPIPIQSNSKVFQYNYGLHYKSNREFVLAAKNCQVYYFNLYIQQNCFDKYFIVCKEDQYMLKFRKKLLKEQQNTSNSYSLETLKTKKQFRSKDSKTDIDLFQHFDKCFKTLDFVMSKKLIIPQTFAKIIIRSDRIVTSDISATLYIVQEAKDQSGLEINYTSITQIDLQNVSFLKRTVTFDTIRRQYGLEYQKCKLYQRNLIKDMVCEWQQAVVENNQSIGKSGILLKPNYRTIQSGVFLTQYYHQKYYHPLTISLIGTKKRIHAIRLYRYNQTQINQQSYLIICREDWYKLQKLQRLKYFKNQKSILQQHLLCSLIKTEGYDFISLFNKIKQLQHSFTIDIQTFLNIL